jgi:raffinose/stachyose/melibiose transport system substrate-binding protein
MRFTVRAALAVSAVVATIAGAGCGGGGGGSSSGGGSAKGQINITCEVCYGGAGDVFQKYRKQLTDAFNAKYKGRYHVDSKPYIPSNDSDAAQHYQRAAVTGTLPDLFAEQATIVRDVARTGRLFDFGPALGKDTAWASSFRPGVFASVTDGAHHVWGIPEGRDAVGIFYNKALFKKAGIAAFPTTWDELMTDCSKLEGIKVIPFAMDGDWVTQLMWSNLIGTQPGGAAFLASGIKNGGFASNPIVVKATEFLKQMHTSGCVNKDAFSGDFNRAAAPFLGGQAAMIANGPWMVSDIAKTKLDVGYAGSPGNGVLVIPGSEAWASGAKDDAHREAVVAFMKFMTSDRQELQKARVTGSFWPTKLQVPAAEAKRLEPLAYALNSEADRVQYTYPHSKFATPEQFSTTWINNWPAYVQGKMSTQDFLSSLSDAVKQQH